MSRFLSRFGASGSLLFGLLFIVQISVLAFGSPRSSAPSTATAYTICYANAASGGKEYLSAIFDAGQFDPHAHERQTWGTGELAFQKYIYMNVETQIGSAGCMVYPSLARAQQVLQTWKNEEKTGGSVHFIETGWVYKGPESSPAATQAATSGQYVLCFSDAGQSPLYLSGDIHIPEPPTTINQTLGSASARKIDQLRSEFLAFIQKQYGYQSHSSYPASCQGNQLVPRDVTATRDRLRSRFPQLKFVETGWVPGITATSDLSKPAAAPAASPAMSAYEQAMMAQRPKSVSGAALQQSMKAANGAASSAAAKPAATTALYAFCGGSVTPRTGGHTTYYMTRLFSATPSMQPMALFSTWLSHAHPHDQTGGISCSSPQTMNSLEPSRQHAMEIQRKAFTVVEVTWNPEM